MLCVASLTTDDFWSKGELFFVGPSYMQAVTLEIARFLCIPGSPLHERIEYRNVDTDRSLPNDELQEKIKKCLRVLRDEESVGFNWIPRTDKARRKKKFDWLNKHCV